MLLLVIASAPADGRAAIDRGQGTPLGESTADQKAGLVEQLGERIPLDTKFVDENGSTVQLSDIITGPTLIVPVYYRCSNVCNYLQVRLVNTVRNIRNTPGKDFRIISVSFDEQESAGQAAQSKKMYLSALDKQFPSDGWRFLTGNRAAIRRLLDTAGYRFERSGSEFIHPVATFVVSRDGTIVRYLYGLTILPRDLSLAFAEAERGVSGTSIRKLVEYCFTFDPVGKTYVFNLLRVSASVVFLTAGGFLAFLILGGKKRKVRRVR